MAKSEERELNLDPITHEMGAHPVGTGLGAAGGAVAGVAIGGVGGPVGAAVGLIAGAAIGGLGGKAVAESVHPTVEHAFWRDRYAEEPYYQVGRRYDDYGPAYEYGWTSWGLYPGSFERVESDLGRHWDAWRGGSALTWPEARPAAQAAWERASLAYGPVGEPLTRENINADDVVRVLNGLLETSRDGEMGFREVAEHTITPSLQTMFLARAQECQESAAELQQQIDRFGGEVAQGGTALGALHRGWVAVRGSLGGLSDLAMLTECERGEDAALARYSHALQQQLPQDARAIVVRQWQGVQRHHDLVRRLREQERERNV